MCGYEATSCKTFPRVFCCFGSRGSQIAKKNDTNMRNFSIIYFFKNILKVFPASPKSLVSSTLLFASLQEMLEKSFLKNYRIIFLRISSKRWAGSVKTNLYVSEFTFSTRYFFSKSPQFTEPEFGETPEKKKLLTQSNSFFPVFTFTTENN